MRIELLSWVYVCKYNVIHIHTIDYIYALSFIKWNINYAILHTMFLNFILVLTYEDSSATKTTALGYSVLLLLHMFQTIQQVVVIVGIYLGAV